MHFYFFTESIKHFVKQVNFCCFMKKYINEYKIKKKLDSILDKGVLWFGNDVLLHLSFWYLMRAMG